MEQEFGALDCEMAAAARITAIGGTLSSIVGCGEAQRTASIASIIMQSMQCSFGLPNPMYYVLVTKVISTIQNGDYGSGINHTPLTAAELFSAHTEIPLLP